jgi:uncharacterized protein (DUF1800 family)
MMYPAWRFSIGAGDFRRFWTVLLISAVVSSPAILSASKRHSRNTKMKTVESPLTDEQRAMHALDRLTFGPRPGDLEKVEAQGVEQWIAMQLDPEKIDDSSLRTELANYPAMQMRQQDLVKDFPSGEVIRAVGDGKIGLPRDPVERAIYQNQVASYLERKQKQAEEAALRPPAAGDVQAMKAGSALKATPEPAPEPTPGVTMNPSASLASPSEEVNEQKVFADLQGTQIVNLPPDQRLNKLVGMQPEEFRTFLKDLTKEQRAQFADGMTPQQKETVYALANPTALVTGEVMQTRLLTDIDSQRQLQAVMTDFWLNHFNVYLRKGELAPWYLADYQQNVIAPRAMGKFEDLLVATAESPAMLFYLDNHTSIGPHSIAALRAQMNPATRRRDPGLNENYGRELMELHTLGVDGGYTQKDVTEVAKVFTGWTIEDPRKGGGFVFDERRHEPGPKYVLGHTIQENGQREGLEVLHLLATNPATAHFLSLELAIRFVSDTPPPALVDRIAKTYLATGGDIREVLRTMFASPEFWSRDSYRAKVKTPEEFVISAVRATGGEVLRPALVLNAMNELGMPFYGCQSPNGYAWTASAWVNTGDLLNRMNIALALSSHGLGTMTDMDALMQTAEPGITPEALPLSGKERDLEKIFLNGQLTSEARDAVLQQVGEQQGAGTTAVSPQARPAPGAKQGIVRKAALIQMTELAGPIPPPADKEAALLAGLLLGSPEFQER